MNDTIDILMNHMSVRKYKDQPVEREISDIIVSCAERSPTSNHFQAYTIIEVQSQSKKEFLAHISGEQEWVAEAPLVLLFCADLKRGQKYYENVDKEIFHNAECYTAAVVDASLAMQRAYVAAQSLGLGGVIVGGIRNRIEETAKEFKLPTMVAPLFLLCLGYPDQNPGLKPRLPRKEIYKIDFYDDSDQDELIAEYNETVSQYYVKRTGGEINDRWTERCGKSLEEEPGYAVGPFLKSAGFLTHS